MTSTEHNPRLSAPFKQPAFTVPVNVPMEYRVREAPDGEWGAWKAAAGEVRMAPSVNGFEVRRIDVPRPEASTPKPNLPAVVAETQPASARST